MKTAMTNPTWRALALATGALAACGTEVTVADLPSEPDPGTPASDRGFVGVETTAVSTLTAGQALVPSCDYVGADGRLYVLEDDATPPTFEVTPADAVLRDSRGVTALRAGAIDVRCVVPGSDLPPGPTRAVAVRPTLAASTGIGVPEADATAGRPFDVRCEAFDAFGNRVRGASFSITDDGAAVPSNPSDDEGAYTVTLTRAGEHRLACGTDGATVQSPGRVTVRSGPPASVRLEGPGFGTLLPPSVEEPVAYAPSVFDAFGNAVDGVDVRIAGVSPEDAAQVVGDLNVVPLRAGAAALELIVESGGRRWAGFGDFTTIIETLFGPSPGVPRCLDPQDNSQIFHASGDAYPFLARVFDVPADGRVLIDDRDVTAALQSDGLVAATIEPAEGLNLVEIRVEDAGVVTSRRLCAFHATQRWLPPDASGRPGRLPHGVTAGAHQFALNDDDRSDLDSLIDLVRTVADSDRLREQVDAAVQASLPSLDLCVGPTTTRGCELQFRVGYGSQQDRGWSDRLTLAPLTRAEVQLLDPPANANPGAPGRVQLDLGLGDVGARFTVDLTRRTITGSETTELATLEAVWGGADLTAVFDVGLAGGLPQVGFVDLVYQRVGNLRVDLGVLDQRLHFAINDWLLKTLLPAILRAVENELRPVARSSFRELYLPARTELGDRLDAGLAFERLDGRELALSGSAGFDRLDVRQDQLIVGTGLRFDFAPDPSVGVTGTDRGVLLTQLPGPVDPLHRAMQPLASTMKLGALNQTFDALWRLGLFELAVSTDDLPEDAPSLPFSGALEVSMGLPPVVVSPEAGQVQLMFGPLDVRTNADVLGRDAEATLRYAALASVRPRIEDGRLVLDRPQIDRLWFNVQGLAVVAAAEAPLEQGVTELGNYLIERLLAEAWTSPPFPVLAPPSQLVGYDIEATDRFGVTSPELLVTDQLDVRGGVGRLPPDP